MALSTPSGITITFDDSGGTPRDITQFVLTINDVDVEQLIEEVHSFGDSWEEHLPIGIGKAAAIELGGLYNDVANGPDALLKISTPDTPATGSRTLVITWAPGRTTTVECYRVSYKRTADRAQLTKYTATLQPTGQVTEA